MLIYSKTLQDYQKHVRLVQQRFFENLPMKAKKYQHHQPIVRFIVNILGGRKVRTDPNKIKYFLDWAIPDFC